MKTAVFCFGKFHFLLVVGDMLKQKRFHYTGFGLFGRQYNPLISANIEIFLHSVLRTIYSLWYVQKVALVRGYKPQRQSILWFGGCHFYSYMANYFNVINFCIFYSETGLFYPLFFAEGYYWKHHHVNRIFKIATSQSELLTWWCHVRMWCYQNEP